MTLLAASAAGSQFPIASIAELARPGIYATLANSMTHRLDSLALLLLLPLRGE